MNIEARVVRLKHAFNASVDNQSAKTKQASREGKSAITIFVPESAKCRIRAALADAGHGLSFQAGLTSLINQLLESQGRESIV